MRDLFLAVLILSGALSATAAELPFSKAVKASVVFRADVDAARHYPNVLKVFLRLDNVHDSNVSWVANGITGIEAELLDAAGKPVSQGPGPMAASVSSNAADYLLPFGSQLDWMISHGGISMAGDAKDTYALIVGGKGWLVPIKTAGSYSLRIRLRGSPWRSSFGRSKLPPPELLLDLPPAKLQVEK